MHSPAIRCGRDNQHVRINPFDRPSARFLRRTLPANPTRVIVTRFARRANDQPDDQARQVHDARQAPSTNTRLENQRGGMAQKPGLKTAILCHLKRDSFGAANSSGSFVCDRERRSKAAWHSKAKLPSRKPLMSRIAECAFGVFTRTIEVCEPAPRLRLDNRDKLPTSDSAAASPLSKIVTLTACDIGVRYAKWATACQSVGSFGSFAARSSSTASILSVVK